MGSGYTVTFHDADPDDVDLLGGKGAGLARMTQSGLRVPPGYIISTRACREYLTTGTLPAGLREEVFAGLAELERRAGKSFGSGPTPLLVSVRSGAPVSMPGMMDTILNLGVNRAAAVALADLTGDLRFVADLVVRFHGMYADTVLGALDNAADPAPGAVARSADAGAMYDTLWQECDAVVHAELGRGVPTDPGTQLVEAVEAVFRSWDTRRARTYREHHGIPHDLGTAVVVQAMVFGNLSADSGSGVVFTRNPVTGEPEPFGEFLSRSQGEDVVAGVRTPERLPGGLDAAVYAELVETCTALEGRYADVLDIEFTVERSTLYLLQVRSAKRTPEAAVRIAADFLDAGAVPPHRALQAVTAEAIRKIQQPGFDADELQAARADGRVLTTGIGASPGQVSGELVLDPDRAKDVAGQGRAVILARRITSPADLHGMIAADGIVTGTGGSTSHAAVVARALGKACVVGCSDADIDPDGRTVTAGGRIASEGEAVSLDGTTGELILGTLARSSTATASGALGAVLRRATEAADCTVFGRVTLPSDIEAAREGGATGLVTAVDDVLAATGHLDALVRTLLDQREVSTVRLQDVEEMIAAEFSPLLAAAGDLDVGVRAIDFLADESRELLQQTALTSRFPGLSMPLGVPSLIEAQLGGLARAAEAAGTVGRVHLAVRHICDPAEALALRELHEQTVARRGLAGAVTIGSYLTSPRGIVNVGGIAAASDVVWVEVRVLQAAMYGIPPRQLLTQQPLEDYVRRGLLGSDPRSALDASVQALLTGVADAAAAASCDIGMRLSGAVAEEVAGRLYQLGFRRFAVDGQEIRPVLLALGKAALAR